MSYRHSSKRPSLSTKSDGGSMSSFNSWVNDLATPFNAVIAFFVLFVLLMFVFASLQGMQKKTAKQLQTLDQKQAQLKAMQDTLFKAQQSQLELAQLNSVRENDFKQMLTHEYLTSKALLALPAPPTVIEPVAIVPSVIKTSNGATPLGLPPVSSLTPAPSSDLIVSPSTKPLSDLDMALTVPPPPKILPEKPDISTMPAGKKFFPALKGFGTSATGSLSAKWRSGN